jgi:hypothetical protein
MNRDAAALLPIGGIGELLGGHKGYGLATLVEIFSAAFQNGTYLTGLHDTDKDGRPQFLRIGHSSSDQRREVPASARLPTHRRKHLPRAPGVDPGAGAGPHLHRR